VTENPEPSAWMKSASKCICISYRGL